MELKNSICTPHLKASTDEAQNTVARDVAEPLVDDLLHGEARNVVKPQDIEALLTTRT
jgi:phosphoglycerate dehydrogenase-like enzyme